MNNSSHKGVSPVIGVVILVAITIIIGVVLANFAFNITDRFTDSADATVSFQQDATGTSGEYTATIRVVGMSNADYLAVTAVSENSNTYDTDYVGSRTGDEITPSDVEYAPDTPTDSPSISDNGAILIRNGDRVTINNLESGDRVQIFGGLNGKENLITDFVVQDLLP